MRIGVALVLVAMMAACGGSGGPGLFRQYEYEEEMYLSLDGSATIYVNGSVQAFNALRGTAFDADPRGRFDDQAVRRYFTSPATRVTRVSRPSRRNNRRYIHVRLAADDVRRLAEAPPFAWSAYRFGEEGDLAVYRQTVGAPAAGAGAARAADTESREAQGAWTGDEIVAFRMHLPSVIVYHNSEGGPRRGNILVWEQSLTDRLEGRPVEIDVRMETESILHRTLILFAATIVAVALCFGLIIWWVVRRPRRRHAG